MAPRWDDEFVQSASADCSNCERPVQFTVTASCPSASNRQLRDGFLGIVFIAINIRPTNLPAYSPLCIDFRGGELNIPVFYSRLWIYSCICMLSWLHHDAEQVQLACERSLNEISSEIYMNQSMEALVPEYFYDSAEYRDSRHVHCCIISAHSWFFAFIYCSFIILLKLVQSSWSAS